MLVTCDWGNETFRIRFEPPLRGFAVCTDCGEEREIPGEQSPPSGE
jgi:hypothetical protein